MERRGVAAIPNYHFRDDGLMLWFAIKRYIEKVVDIFYQNDDDVAKDYELQLWSIELCR